MENKNISLATINQLKAYSKSVGTRILSNMPLNMARERAHDIVKNYPEDQPAAIVLRDLNFESHIVIRVPDGTVVTYDTTSEKETLYIADFNDDTALIIWEQISSDVWWYAKSASDTGISDPVDITRNIVLDRPMPVWKHTIFDKRVRVAVSEAGFICDINYTDDPGMQISVIDGDTVIGIIDFISIMPTDREINLVPVKSKSEAPDRCSNFEWCTLRDYIVDQIVKIADNLDN